MSKFEMEQGMVTQTWQIHSEKVKQVASIEFRDKKFYAANFASRNPYTRDDLKLLAFIESCITKIEKGMIK